MVIGFLGGKWWIHKQGKYQLKNLDDLMLLISGLIIFVSIILAAIDKLEKFSVVAINVFGTMVFSWILTKKTAKQEFKEHEQELALKSYRHINYIESAANTAYKEMESSRDSAEDDKTKLILEKALDHIKYIQGGVYTCKLDWYDMLSEKDREEYKDKVENEQDKGEFGVIRINISNSQINQEDA